LSTLRRSVLPYFAVLALAVLPAACSSKAEGQDQSAPGAGKAAAQATVGGRQTLGVREGVDEAVPVEVITPWRSDLGSYVFGNAHVEALRVVDIIARVDGQLESMPVEEGDQVKAGQVVARLDKSQLKLVLDEAAAQLENTRSAYDRSQKMMERDLTSRETLDNTKYQFETSKTKYERAELNLLYATITAPFNGIITRRLIEVGGMIRANTILFSIADMSKLLARVYVPEKEMGRISLDDRVQIESEMFPGERFSGAVEMISPVVDPTTGTVKITVRVTDSRQALKPGMFCSVYILTDTHQNALVISRRALLTDVDNPEVFVVDETMTAHRRPVVIGIQQGDTLEVLSGVQPTDRVVLIGQENLREGTPVKISEGVERAVSKPESPAAQ
jgi:membrane fusion protein, multidrug efflux system